MNEHQQAMDDFDDAPPPITRPWIHLETSGDVEGWIENYNRDLQRTLGRPDSMSFGPGQGQGICFNLEAGGEIYLHTTADGDVLLDVTPEAEWATPVIGAATGTAPPGGQIWPLPAYLLTQLILGLSMLIASTTIVPRHDFRTRRY
ncbi:hypothetical protein [Noviherbaspirillum soli]|uniref:hypothetical protein n=1 Tax=Noviherbaspirillum soli TaxID=1064518 RepID=UPI001E485C96|nr:hypothetical protein [Noviherbaspirillum soli]